MMRENRRVANMKLECSYLTTRNSEGYGKSKSSGTTEKRLLINVFLFTKKEIGVNCASER
jgi:hypothetical protein